VTSGDLKRAKRAVRRRVLEARDGIEATARDAMAVEVTDRFLALPEVEAARTVMAFSSFGSELSTAPLIDALSSRDVLVGLPKIDGDALEVRAFRPGDPTTVTPFGALEPADGAPIDPQTIDVVVTPAVAYDRMGRRVGYGGGFYDRFLLRTRPDTVRVGIGASVQLVEEDLPAGAFDLRVHLIVMPDGIVRCPP
jgi:5-formyltetrahydrofolate cyclo-ligase